MQTNGVRYDPQARFAVAERDLEYRRDGTTSWLVHIYRPQGPGPFPALLEVHGGAWQGGDRLQNRAIDEALAASGIVVAAIDFHAASEAPYPASVADVNYATRWLKVHAAELGADPAAVAAMGYSSGAHLLLLSATRPHDPRYAALELPEAPAVDASLPFLVVGWPVLDPYSRYQFAQAGGMERLMAAGLAYFGDEAAMLEGNPQQVVERGEAELLPPLLIVQGTADNNLTPGMAERFVEAYSSAGGVVELGKYPGAPHGFAREPGENTDRALEQIRGFVARQLARLGS